MQIKERKLNILSANSYYDKGYENLFLFVNFGLRFSSTSILLKNKIESITEKDKIVGIYTYD